jgi:tetratricopeptide (TPR) repeat protein
MKSRYAADVVLVVPVMSAFDQALAAWRSNPSAMSTVALCSYLGPSQHHDLIREVGERASTWHVNDSNVMLAVGRMYLDANLLAEAQTALTQAGKVGSQSASAHRFLGEVLLRRGDAVRAERVLSRAIELGANDAESRSLHDRASFYTPLQKRVGAQAVASEVARALPKHPSLPPNGPSRARSQPSFDSDSHEISDVMELDDVTAENAISLASNGPSPAYRVSGAPISARAGGVPAQATPSTRRPAGLRPQNNARAVPQSQPQRERESSYEDISDFVDDYASLPSFADYEPPAAKLPTPGVAQRLAAVPQALPSRPPYVEPAAPARATRSDRVLRSPEAAVPQPGLVLEHLARVGVYEPRGGAAPLWESAPKQKARGSWLLIGAIALVTAAGGGGYEYSRRVKARMAGEALTLNAEVAKMIAGGRVAALKATDQKLARSFDLDSRSQQAARLWLENRVLGVLFLGADLPGVDSAVHRGRATGLPEKDLAAGRIASFYVEGDLAGAAALLPKWDRDAGDDAFYQLAGGAVLERAGDPRAIERYDAARRLDPKLVPADIFHARLLLLEQGPAKARPVLDALHKKSVEPAALKALDAMAWALDPNRGETARETFTPAEIEALPAPLRAAPAIAEAVEALTKNEIEAANKAIDRALASADSPALAATLGSLALETGDEQLARKAALRALSFSALYPRARALAARVALLGGRLDEAQKATEGLEPSSPDVAVVRGVIAYEMLELSDLGSAREALGGDAAAPPFQALALAPAILNGTKYPPTERLQDLAVPSVAWGDVVAVDAALDTGNLALASALLGRRSLDTAAPAYRARVARLRRYEKKIDEALLASAAALDAAPTATLLIERSYELIEKDEIKAAKELIAKHPTLLGPLSGWLGVMTDVASKQANLAAVRLTKLELPPDDSPVVLRVLAARALAAAKDKRAKPYALQLLRTLRKHPDVLLALETAK